MYRQQWRQFAKTQRGLDNASSVSVSTFNQSERSGYQAQEKLPILNPVPSTSRGSNILVADDRIYGSKKSAEKAKSSKLPSYAAFNASHQNESKYYSYYLF